MRQFLPKTIKYRILLVLILLQIVFLIFIGTLGYHFIQNNFLDQLNKRAAAITIQLDSALKTAFVSSDLATISAVVHEVSELPDLNEISIYINSNLIFKKKSASIHSANRILLKRDVIASGDTVGTIEIDFSTDELEKAKKEILIGFFMICLLILLIAFIFSFAVSQYLSNKTETLLGGLHKYALGDSDFRFKDLSEDEFGQIYLAFNKMANSLNTQTADIEKLRILNEHNSKMSALGEMAGGLSHEINNPITIINGKADYIKKIVSKGTYEPEKIVLELEKIEKPLNGLPKLSEA